jgi:hypothetical protein
VLGVVFVLVTLFMPGGVAALAVSLLRRQALDWVQDGLVTGRMLRDVEVTAAMPKERPWTR